MKLILSSSLFLLTAGMSKATMSPTTDNAIPDLGLVVSTATPNDSFSLSSLALEPALRDTKTPMSATFPPRFDAQSSLPTAAPILPNLPPSAAFISSPTMTTTTTTVSRFPSLAPSISTSPTIAPSLAPVVTPTKRPSNGIVISSVKVTGLRMSLINVGPLQETDRWRMETEQLYDGYLEDMTSSVRFVKSQLSEENGRSVNTITYDLVLQSEYTVISDSMQYAIAPFQDLAANIRYGIRLRALSDFETLSLPIPVPQAPKRTDGGSKDELFIIGKLNMHARLGIVVAGISGLIYVVYRCNRWRGHRQLSKPSDEPNCTFRISSDDDVSTIGPIEDVAGSKDDQRPDHECSKAFDGCIDISNSARTVRTGSSAIAKARGSGSTNFTEDYCIEVLISPGKLGMLIDTPDDGPPVIHALKASSAVRNLIQVGDKLIAIDDEDVRQMTAIQVSGIISSKSSNPQRKFTIIRPYDVVDIV